MNLKLIEIKDLMSIINIRNGLPVFVAASSVLLTLTFGILQIVGAHPFTEKNVTFGWIYISISMTVAAFCGMYIGFGLIYIYDQIFGTYNEPARIQMEEIGQVSGDHQEMDLSDRPERTEDRPKWTELSDGTDPSDKKDKRVKFDFNHVLII